jgi:hypothetical protein
VIGHVRREQDSKIFELVVGPAVLVVVSQRVAYGKPMVGPNRDVAEIEESMQVPAQRNAVANRVFAAHPPRADVRSFENRKRVLCRDGTRLAVGIKHRDSKRALSEARLDQLRITVPSLVKSLVNPRNGLALGALETGPPKRGTLAARKVIGAAADDVTVPSRGTGPHSSGGKKVGSVIDTQPIIRSLSVRTHGLPLRRASRSRSARSSCTPLLSPKTSQPHGQARESREETKAADS